jgi:hypothetical protein
LPMMSSLRLWPSLCLAMLGCSSDCELQDDLRLFAGDDALDCGIADAAHDRAEVDQCVLEAFSAGDSFLARYRGQGEDSKLERAVAMNSEGKVKIFRWDSSPCGGGSCEPATDVQSCEGPSPRLETSEDEGELPLECGSFGLAQRVCG